MDQLDYKLILKKVLKRWYLFVLILPISFLLALVYLQYQTNLYAVDALLKINGGKISDEASVLEEIFPQKRMGFSIEDEIKVLRSYSLNKKALSNTGLHTAYKSYGDIKINDQYHNAAYAITLDSNRNV